MEEADSSKKPLYCHWDSHEQDVLFMNENELDQHIYSHFSRFPDDAPQYTPEMSLTPKSPDDVIIKQEEEQKLQQTVECHWDACHEFFDIDEIMEHFRTSHLDVSQHPHDASCMREIKQCLIDSPKNDGTSHSHHLPTTQDKVQSYSDATRTTIPCYNAGYHPHSHVTLNNMSPSSTSSSHHSSNSDYGTTNMASVSSAPGASGSSGTTPNSPGYYQMHMDTMLHNYNPDNVTTSSSVSPVSYPSQSEVAPPAQEARRSSHTPNEVLPSSNVHPDKQVKIDISSLPTLSSVSACSSSSSSSVPTDELSYDSHTCMWLTSDGVCGEHFYTSNELNAHIVHKHIDTRCPSCKWDGCKRENLPFNHRQKIIRHIQVHARTTDHKCHICHRLMNSDALLKTHELRHYNQWPFKCETCGRTFRTKNSLNVHTRTHTGIKPFVCSFPGCGKRFAESSNLAKHRRTHMDPQFMCPVCSRMFTRRDHLRRHMRTKGHFESSTHSESSNDTNPAQSLQQVPSSSITPVQPVQPVVPGQRIQPEQPVQSMQPVQPVSSAVPAAGAN